jgi:hypothetical protein
MTFEDQILKESQSIDWSKVPVGTLIYTSDHLSNLVHHKQAKTKPRVFMGVKGSQILSIKSENPVAYRYAILEKPND